MKKERDVPFCSQPLPGCMPLLGDIRWQQEQWSSSDNPGFLQGWLRIGTESRGLVLCWSGVSVCMWGAWGASSLSLACIGSQTGNMITPLTPGGNNCTGAIPWQASLT